MIELLNDPEVWISFLTLTFLEIVLGIDNIIFLSILVSKLPAELQPRGRVLGLAFAMITRIALLFSLVWLTRLVEPWFTVLGGETLRGFAVSLAIGIVIGTYSSIYVAGAIALDLGASARDFMPPEKRGDVDDLP